MSIETEKILLAEIFKKNGIINFDISDDAYSYELLGFLKCVVKNLEKQLIEGLE